MAAAYSAQDGLLRDSCGCVCAARKPPIAMRCDAVPVGRVKQGPDWPRQCARVTWCLGAVEEAAEPARAGGAGLACAAVGWDARG